MVMRSNYLASTDSAVSWSVFESDDFCVPRIALTFSAAPTSAGNVTLKVDSASGAGYDHVIRTINPVGQTTVNVEGIYGFSDGDKLLVEYANPDSVDVSGVATTEIDPPSNINGEGMSASDGVIRSRTATYRRYYHTSLTSADPGASGATWTEAGANQLAGWLLDADTEHLECHVDIHSDWDGTSSPVMELVFTIQDDNTIGGATDTIDFEVVARYAQPDISIRTQTVTCEKEVGAAAQYSVWKCEIELDPLATSNQIAVGDAVSLRIRVLGIGDLTQAVVNSISFWYPTTHVGIEAGDV